MNKIVLGIVAVVLAALFFLLTYNNSAKKQSSFDEIFPSKPITLIVPFSAGGGADLLARSMEKLAMKHLGQPLTIVNKPGGGGTLGWNELAGASPDGYTVGLSASSTILQPLYTTTRYHYLTALDPLATAVSLPIIMVTAADQPWKTSIDVAQYARQHPNQLKFGHSGLGTFNHVVAEMFAKKADIELEQVPFQGGSEALAALLGGHIQLAFCTPPEIIEHIKAEKVKVLAATGTTHLREPALQDVPTFQEQGYPIPFNNWFGVAIPKGVPHDVKNKLVTGFRNLIQDPEFKAAVEKQGLTLDYLNDEESVAKWLEQSNQLRTVVEETGIAEKIRSQKK